MDLLDDAVHFPEFGLHQGTVGASQMPNVIQPQVMQNDHIPVGALEGRLYVTSHIVVDLSEEEKNSLI